MLMQRQHLGGLGSPAVFTVDPASEVQIRTGAIWPSVGVDEKLKFPLT
jgi:hypothetical protein